MTAPAPPRPAPSEPVPAPLSLAELRRNVGRFFFAEEVPYGVAACRIAMAVPMLCDAVERWPHARELYSADGAPSALWHSYGFPNALPELPGWAAVGLFTLYVFALVTALVGWKARTSCGLAAAGCFYFCNLDMTGSLTKYTVIATHVFLLLSLSRCGAVWSVDARAARRANAARGLSWRPETAPAWPRRLIQAFIGVVYFGAAFTKLHMDEFFNGDQMTYWMVTNVNGVHPLGGFMAVNPVLLLVGAYATCLWEITFLMLAWRGWGRRVWLAAGVFFHLGTTLTLGLYIFPLVCWAAYWAFLNEDDVRAFRAAWAKVAARLPGLPAVRLPAVPAAATRWGYLAAAPLIAFAGMGAEYRLDPYGERGPDGPLPLKEVGPALIHAMSAPHRGPRPVDQLWDFDLGRRLVGGNLLGRDDRFATGDVVFAQAWLSPPHDDAVLECGLRYADGPDGAGPVIARQTNIMVRDLSRQTFKWTLDGSLPPGRYRMTLAIDGVHVADEYFTLAAD